MVKTGSSSYGLSILGYNNRFNYGGRQQVLDAGLWEEGGNGLPNLQANGPGSILLLQSGLFQEELGSS
jgi:hypothetical protein